MDETLPERVFLLGYDLEKERFTVADLQFRGQLLRAAAAVELVAAGLLTDRGGKAVRRAAKAPQDPFLAEVWRSTSADKPRNWLRVVHDDAHRAESAVRERLAATGAVTPHRGSRLAPLPARHDAVNHPERIRDLRDRTRNAVLGGAAPSAVPRDELALAVLAAEGRLSSVFTGGELRTHRRELKALTEHFDTTVPGLRKGLRSSITSSAAYGGGWSS